MVAIGTVISSCSKYDIEKPSLSVTYEPANPQVGQAVTFTVRHDAQYLATYPGDSAHEWDRSLAYAEINGGDTEGEFLQEMTPNTMNYFVDFRVIGATNDEIPAEVQTNNITASMDYDPVFDLWAMRLSNPNENTDSLALAIVNPGSYLWGENKILEMDFRAIDTANMEMTIYLEVGGAQVSSGLSWVREVGADVNNFMLYDGLALEKTDQGYDFNLETLVDSWVVENPSVAEDSLEVTQMTIVFKPTEDSPRAWTDVYISFMELGYPDLRPFDTGFNIDITDLGGKQTFNYTYQEAGTYSAMFIATNVDYISRSVDYQESREPSASEYDFLRAFREVTIQVTE